MITSAVLLIVSWFILEYSPVTDTKVWYLVSAALFSAIMTDITNHGFRRRFK